MAMKDMKNKPEAMKKEMCGPCAGPMEAYPWGLRLNLQSQQLDKLPAAKSVQVGETVIITARAKVVEKRSNEVLEGNGKTVNHDTMELQITHMELAGDAKRAEQRGFEAAMEEGD